MDGKVMCKQPECTETSVLAMCLVLITKSHRFIALIERDILTCSSSTWVLLKEPEDSVT